LRPIDAALVERLLRDHDFSSARAALVASASGRFAGDLLNQFGHLRLRALLAAEPMPAAWRALPLVMQVTSLGSFEEKWLMEEVVPSFTAGRYGAQAPAAGSSTTAAAAAGVQPAPGLPLDASQVYLIWPTMAEVAAGNKDWRDDECDGNLAKNVAKDFLQPLWARWGGAPAGREEDVAHMKSVVRFEPATKRIAWLLQGSHNLSVAAWGRLEIEGTQLYVPSYELSALSLPSLELAYRRHRHCGFRATTGASASSAAAPQSVRFFAARQAGAEDIAAAGAAGAAPVLLPVPYKLPPERYGEGDKPWC
jgi:tyrosyl-DNA phosphodiesterase-1